MPHVKQARRFGALAALALIIAGAGWAMSATETRAGTGGQSATIKPVPPTEPIKKGDARIPIDITIDGAQNMASIQFTLLYNADIFDVADAAEGPVIQKGDFLGSTGREVVCADPVVEPGAARLTCVTLRPTPAGPDGAGKLATVFLKAIGSGKTELTLANVRANKADDSASDMPLNPETAPVEVQGGGGGVSWLLWVAIIVIAAIGVSVAIGFVAMRARSKSKSEVPAPGSP